MSRDGEQDAGRRPEERAALDAVRGLRPPEPTPEEAARARSAFLTGRRAGEAASVAPPAPTPGASGPWGRMLALAAVLAVVVGAGWWGTRPADHWVVTDVVARTGVNIAVGCGNPGETVYPGSVVTADTSEFELQLGQSLRMRMLGGTEIQLPGGPGRWFGKDRTLLVEAGEVFGTTAGPLGYRLRLVTPEATAELTGTTFAVFRTPEATCFCLWDGALDITTTAGDDVDLPTGRRVFLYRDGRPPQIEPLDDMETMKLSMMSDGGMMDPLPEHP